MKIEHREQDAMLVALDDAGTEMGRITYERQDDGTLAATHTIVPPEFGGRGIAGALVDALCDYASAEDIKIRPVCSYVVKAFQKNPDKYSAVEAEA